MVRIVVLLVLALGMMTTLVHADVDCLQLDDDLRTGRPMSDFMSASTGTIMVWHKPVGTGQSEGQVYGPECYSSGILVGAYETGEGVWASIARHPLVGGTLDRYVAFNWDAAANCALATYTPETWTHLAWVHGSGTLKMYKDGVETQSVAAGNTFSMVGLMHLCTGQIFDLQEIPTTGGMVTGFEMFPTALGPAEIRAEADARLHHFGSSARTGAWTLDDCPPGASAHGVTFYDSSNNGRHITGHHGTTFPGGLMCRENTVLTYPWGVE